MKCDVYKKRHVIISSSGAGLMLILTPFMCLYSVYAGGVANIAKVRPALNMKAKVKQSAACAPEMPATLRTCTLRVSLSPESV
jgi:hypothetical protein